MSKGTEVKATAAARKVAASKLTLLREVSRKHAGVSAVRSKKANKEKLQNK